MIGQKEAGFTLLLSDAPINDYTVLPVHLGDKLYYLPSSMKRPRRSACRHPLLEQVDRTKKRLATLRTLQQVGGENTDLDDKIEKWRGAAAYALDELKGRMAGRGGRRGTRDIMKALGMVGKPALEEFLSSESDQVLTEDDDV